MRIGILGGMGPASSLRLYQHITEMTPVRKDQDHLEVIVASLPKTPDRTEAILGKGSSPLPALIEGIKILEKAGADLVIIACNTAHFYLPQIEKQTKVKILNMVMSAGEELLKLNGLKKVGVLATTGTIQTGIYQKYVPEAIEVIVPEVESQEAIMKAIYGERGIKAGYVEENFNPILTVIEELRNKDVGVVILGCTEVSLALEGREVGLPVIDPLKVVAQKVVEMGLKEGVNKFDKN